MSMRARASRVRFSAAMMIGALALAGCAPARDPSAYPSATATRPEPGISDPSRAGLTVGAGEMPPPVFDGNCDAIFGSDEMAALVGIPVGAVSVWADPSIANVGGVTCSYDYPDDGGSFASVTVMPLHALPVGTKDQDWSLWHTGCDRYCTDVATTQDLFVELTLSHAVHPPIGKQDDVDVWVEEIAASVQDSWNAARPESWERDTTGWWPPFTCDSLASSIGERVEKDLAGVETTGGDIPAPSDFVATDLLDRSAAGVSCNIVDAASGDPEIDIGMAPGYAWFFDASGFDGIERVGDIDVVSDEFSAQITDGVNLATLMPRLVDPQEFDEYVSAVADLVAAGFPGVSTAN